MNLPLGRRTVLSLATAVLVAASGLGLAQEGKVKAKASQERPTFIPSPAQAASSGRPAGRTLAGTDNPRLNAALAALCSLQAQGAAPR